MRIDAYMQVSQIYQGKQNQKTTPKTGKAGSRDSLEIFQFRKCLSGSKTGCVTGI